MSLPAPSCVPARPWVPEDGCTDPTSVPVVPERLSGWNPDRSWLAAWASAGMSPQGTRRALRGHLHISGIFWWQSFPRSWGACP